MLRNYKIDFRKKIFLSPVACSYSAYLCPGKIRKIIIKGTFFFPLAFFFKIKTKEHVFPNSLDFWFHYCKNWTLVSLEKLDIYLPH